MPLVWYTLRRLAQAVVVVFIVTVVVFLMLHSLPGGPARGILGAEATPQQIADFNHAQGLDKPLTTQYAIWIGQLLRGDLGRSYSLNATVSSLIAERLPKTLVLTLLSALLGLVVAVPLGLLQAARRNRLSDYLATAVTFVLFSTPLFFFGLVMIIVFSQTLPWLPAQAPQGQTLASVFADPAALVLPVLTGAAPLVAVFGRYMRSSALDNLARDYVRTARAKGTPFRRILSRHVLRNSATPLITMLGYQIPVMFGGALVVEQLFNYPGMGLLFWNAAQSSDFPVLLGCILVISIATVAGSLLADLAHSLIDPRTKAARS